MADADFVRVYSKMLVTMMGSIDLQNSLSKLAL